MNKKTKYILVICLSVVFLDHLTKWLIDEFIPYGHYFPIIDNIFDLVHTRNKGAAFGMLHNWDSPYRNLFFYGIAAVAFVFIIFYIKTT